ncbi:hypothetical protein B4907_09230 [Yersinia kristensenii]|nr:hypothetical protein B4907_09230 [Yersinia kristensenii]
MFVRNGVCGYKCGYKLLVLKINNIDISRLYDISESGLCTISLKKTSADVFFMSKNSVPVRCFLLFLAT